MTALITRDVCERCDHVTRETETGAWYCKASPSGAQECDRLFAAGEIADHAHTCAAAYAVMRHAPIKVRREMAESDAGKYEEAALALGAEFDPEAFLSECGLHRVPA